jgi:hypothetical protein
MLLVPPDEELRRAAETSRPPATARLGRSRLEDKATLEEMVQSVETAISVPFQETVIARKSVSSRESSKPSLQCSDPSQAPAARLYPELMRVG